MRLFQHIFLFILITGAGFACSSKYTIKPGDTLEVAYEKAMGLYERERYAQAARAFETVLSIARGTEVAADAQFYLALSHFENRSYLMAASEFRRFARNHTRDERKEKAEFMEAYCYYKMSPRYNLDQTDTYHALDRFQLFITRYPSSELIPRALEYVDEMRDKLAKKQFHAAEMYMRVKEYRSAALYYDLVVEQFPDSKWAERALVQKILAHTQFAENSIRKRQKERFEEAIESYHKYLQIFPRGENRDLAESYYNRAQNGLLEIITSNREQS